MIPDPSSDWMRFAVQLVMEQDLATSPDLVTTITANGPGVYQLGSDEALTVTIEAARSGKLNLRAVTVDVATQRDLTCPEKPVHS
ncbi:MAG: hypothetical protein M3Y72_10945 [Acidobacteriota bacterium]|nr:hypothetical protein [Acidobacteriota bacterium]